ncbi:MAG TPA: TonB-dependent receptor [Gemmatimonadota bacterium]|nr:TonB-dependent receptor [Gemmatimonadota bacterium]
MLRPFVRAAGFGSVALAALALLALPASALAQQGLTTGAINGQITDNTGAPLAQATVIVRNAETGITREYQTNSQGRYAAGFLQPGRYLVAAQFPPLTEVERGPIQVSLGDDRVVDIALQPVEVAGITVQVAAEQVDVSQGGVVALIDEQQLENLPTLGRDFTDFINLSGLVSVTPEVTTGGQFSLGGGRTSATNVTVDGVDANNAFFGENRGSSRIPFTFSLESIKEFQIVTNGFDVEYGNYTGGVVNAVTKGGTNEFHGSAFGYWRDQAFTANDFSGLEPEEFSVKQFGARLSGPIVRDRAHFFVSVDGQLKDQPVFSIVPERWCPAVFDEAGTQIECVGAADSIARFKDILNQVYGEPLEELEANIGTFEETEDEIAVFGRVDWQLNDRHALILRHNYTFLESLNDRLTDEEARTYGSTFKNEANSFVSELTSVFGDRAQIFNNFRFQWSEEDRPRPANNYLPEIDVQIHADAADVEYFGDGIVFRNRLEESKIQFVDNLTWQLGEAGRHILKIGTNNIFTNIQNTFWLLGTGNFNFDSLEDLENRNVDSYTRFVREDRGTPFANFDISEYSFYAQDEWQVSDQLLLALGLRYDTNVFETPAALAPELVDAFGVETSVVPEDRNNISPRVAFTYDLRGDETAIVRGGVGLLYGRLPFVLHGNVMQSAPPVRNLFCPGGLAPEPDYDFFRQSPDGSNNPFECGVPREADPPEFAVWDPDVENPESWRFNLGYETIVGDGWRLSVDGLYGRTSKNFNVNQINLNEEMFRTAVDNRPVFVAENQFFRNNFNFRSEPRANTDFAGVYFNESTAESESWSLDFKVGKRWSALGLRTDASYTYNNTHDNSSFFCCTSNEGFRTKPTSGNPNFIGDPGDDTDGTWGHADFERQHVFIFSGTFEGPWGIDVSGIWRSQSGTPWTVTVDGDINGDGEAFNDRAPIFDGLLFGRVSGGAIVAGSTAEEAARFQAFLDEDSQAGECLRENLGRIAERNSCRNPWFHSVDLHLSKAFGFTGGHEIELIADMFNVLNGINEDWGQFKAIFGSASEVFRKQGYDADSNRVIYSVEGGFGREGAVGFNPLQFQAQLGVRYRF